MRRLGRNASKNWDEVARGLIVGVGSIECKRLQWMKYVPTRSEITAVVHNERCVSVRIPYRQLHCVNINHVERLHVTVKLTFQLPMWKRKLKLLPGKIPFQWVMFIPYRHHIPPSSSCPITPPVSQLGQLTLVVPFHAMTATWGLRCDMYWLEINRPRTSHNLHTNL